MKPYTECKFKHEDRKESKVSVGGDPDAFLNAPRGRLATDKLGLEGQVAVHGIQF